MSLCLDVLARPVILTTVNPYTIGSNTVNGLSFDLTSAVGQNGQVFVKVSFAFPQSYEFFWSTITNMSMDIFSSSGSLLGSGASASSGSLLLGMQDEIYFRFTAVLTTGAGRFLNCGFTVINTVYDYFDSSNVELGFTPKAGETLSADPQLGWSVSLISRSTPLDVLSFGSALQSGTMTMTSSNPSVIPNATIPFTSGQFLAFGFPLGVTNFTGSLTFDIVGVGNVVPLNVIVASNT
jgi:hypothetical protein